WVAGVIYVGLRDIQVSRRELLVVLGLGIKKSPHGEHRVYVLLVQLLELAGHIWEVVIKDRIAFELPPKPVLHDGVEGNVLLAITAGDSKNLVLRNVTIFRLKEAIGPFREHRRVPSQVAVLVNYLV